MQQEASPRMPWKILAGSWLLAFAMFCPMFCIPPMEHILREELLLTHAQTSLLFTAPILMIVALAIPAGLIADRIGVRKAAGIGAIIIAVGAILRGTATDASSLLAFTFIYGVGLGWLFPNLPKLISTWVPREKVGVATGIYSTGIQTGAGLPLAITMSLVFPITNTFQGVFFIWSIPPIAAAILWWVLVREPTHNSIPSEPTSKSNVLLRRVLQNKDLWLVSILLLLQNFFFYTWSGWVPLLMRLKGATASLAGLITSVTLWVGIPAVLLLPRLSHKLGLRKPFLWVPAIILALSAWGVMHIPLSLSLLIMTLAGIGTATLFTMILILPVDMRPKEEVGTASGLVISVGYIGGILGPLIGGHILDRTGSLDLSLLILIWIAVAAVIIAFRLPETGPKARFKK